MFDYNVHIISLNIWQQLTYNYIINIPKGGYERTLKKKSEFYPVITGRSYQITSMDEFGDVENSGT